MNITLFTENYCRGGVDTFIVTLLNNWPDAGDEFTLVCNEDHPGLADIREKLRRPCRIVTHRIGSYAALAARMRESKPGDMLRKALKPVIKYFFFACAVRELRPLLCDGRAERLMVVNGGYPGGDTCRAAGIAWGRYSGKPASIHNFHNLATPPERCAGLQEYTVDALLSRYTGAFVTVSRAAAQSMSFRSAIPVTQVSYIYNGLEFSEAPREGADLRRELGLPDETPLCMMLGTYEPRKGHRFLLQVFRRAVEQVPAAHFVICGHGSESEVAAVANMVTELDLGGRVHLLGFRSDAVHLLRQADLLLVGSQEFESFGLTCVEAMAQRVPVVATRTGGLPEVVADGEGGFTFDRDDVEGYARQVTEFLCNGELRVQQGIRGFERYMKYFTAQRMAEAYAQLIR